MREVVAFLMWLFSFWTWKAFFLRWLGRPSSHPASGETAEHLASQEGQQQSELARFPSSLPGDERRCRGLSFAGDVEVILQFEEFEFTLVHGTGTEASNFREFLGAVASSEIVFCEKVWIDVSGADFFKHVEAFADALRQAGNSFKTLDLWCEDGSAVLLAKCASSLLHENDAIQELKLEFESMGTKMGKEEVAEFVSIIAMPHNLRVLKSFSMDASDLDGEGMEQLLKPFQGPPSVLEKLEFISLGSNAQLEHISAMLASSTSLKTLRVYTCFIGVNKKALTKGYTSLAVALCSNQSLDSLYCDISSSMELKVLLDPLMPKNNNLQSNTTLTKLTLNGSFGGKDGIETLVDMLCNNTSLLELEFDGVDDFSLHGEEGIENVLAVLEALKTNKSLKKIGFFRCTTVSGYKVLGAMMDLLLENQCIEDIDLWGTGLQESGDADYVYSELSKRKKVRLWSIVQGMANVNPTFGRVFLCGNPYAGKTRLRMSMKQLKEFKRKEQVQNRPRTRDKIKSKLKMSSTPKLPTKGIFLERTHGIEVDTILCNGIGITIWDMAGQTDYHSFHELVMPNLSADGSCSLFLLMCNPMEQWTCSKKRSLSNIKLEIASWLRFIASNTRRSLSFRPHVSIVMTHFDHWMDDTIFAGRIGDVVLELKCQFHEVLEFDKDEFVFKVDGQEVSHARSVFDFIYSHLKQLLERLPQTIRACEEVQRLVALWNADKSKQPLLKWDEFCEGMCKKVKELNDVDDDLARRRKEFVAISLNDGGHIIYNEQAGVVITNPHWFCHHIIGEFLHQCANLDPELEMVSANGIISREHMKRLILHLVEGQGDMEKQFDDILGMMIKLHICYEQDAHCIMIPSTLKDHHESLSWSARDESASFSYVGRRIACQDGIKTMLTLGFFTRLQVSFFKKLESKNSQDTYEVFQDVIKFISDGIEVIIQFHDGDVDILLRSDQCQDKMLEFLKSGVVGHIKYLQADPTLGCPGVHLIESILRPACLRRLVDSKDRKTQCVQVKDLEVEVIKNGFEARHNWKRCEGLGPDYDKVSTLLGSVAWKTLLEKRSRHLQDYYKTIQSLGTMTPNDQSNSNNDNSDSLTMSFWQTTRKFVYGPLDDKLDDIIRVQHDIVQVQYEHHKETMSKLNDVVYMIQRLEHGIEKMQEELLHEVCLKIDGLMAFSVEMHQSQIPKLAYLSEIGKRKLLTRLVPGLNKIQLHLMCESVQGFHEVAIQEGCVVNFGEKHTKRFLAMLSWGLKIATILTKIGAHVACGMGAMVPDFSDVGCFAALILDTPGILDFQLPTTTLESLPSSLKNQSMISIDDKSEAQRWLRDFLEPQCANKREFYEKFRLKKVRYRGSSGCIAWICDECISKHQSDIDELK